MLMFLSLKALKIRASTPTFPNKPLPSKFRSATLSIVEIDLIPFADTSEVIKVPRSSILNVFKTRRLIFFSNRGIMVFACKIVAPKLANSLASENDSWAIFLASATKSGFAVKIPFTCV